MWWTPTLVSPTLSLSTNTRKMFKKVKVKVKGDPTWYSVYKMGPWDSTLYIFNGSFCCWESNVVFPMIPNVFVLNTKLSGFVHVLCMLGGSVWIWTKKDLYWFVMGHMYFSTSWHDKVTATRHDPIYSKGTYSRLGPHHQSVGYRHFHDAGIEPIVSWHVSRSWVLKWGGVSSYNERLRHTIDSSSMFGPTFGFQDSQLFQLKE